MLNQLLVFDTSFFLFINSLPHFYLSNVVAEFLSGIGEWGLVWIVLAILLFIREERRHHSFFFPVLAAGFLAWMIAENIMKYFVSRPRPSIDMGAIIIGGGAYGYSFPSTHTTIAFALATVLSIIEPKFRMWFYLLAFFIGLSRIYLGVHFPLDVAAGAFVGWTIGLLSLRLNSFLLSRFKIR